MVLSQDIRRNIVADSNWETDAVFSPWGRPSPIYSNDKENLSITIFISWIKSKRAVFVSNHGTKTTRRVRDPQDSITDTLTRRQNFDRRLLLDHRPVVIEMSQKGTEKKIQKIKQCCYINHSSQASSSL